MKLQTKIRLANISIWVIVVTIVIIVLFFLGFLISNTFNLTVFADRTSEFILSLFGASLVIVVCGAFLNISLNIGIIADNKIDKKENKQITNNTFNKKFLYALLAIFVVLSSFLFLGDYLTRQDEKKKLISECEETITRYDKSINDIAIALTDTALTQNIPNLLTFLSKQKKEFPNIVLITSDYYNNQLTYLQITPYSPKEELKEEMFGFSFYPCDKNDCEYLKEVFETDKTDYYFWSKDNNYKLYYPITKGKQKFILLFKKYSRHGKFGS